MKDFVKDKFEFLIILLVVTGAFMVNRSDLQGINQEMKDFHGKLCVLEEKYIQMMQRFMEKNK